MQLQRHRQRQATLATAAISAMSNHRDRSVSTPLFGSMHELMNESPDSRSRLMTTANNWRSPEQRAHHVHNPDQTRRHVANYPELLAVNTYRRQTVALKRVRMRSSCCEDLSEELVQLQKRRRVLDQQVKLAILQVQALDRFAKLLGDEGSVTIRPTFLN